MRILPIAGILLGFLSALPGRAAAGMLADYNRALLEPKVRADKHHHMDTPGTIRRLQELGVNAYFLPIRTGYNWDDATQEFLPAARAAHIDVWIYLLPPTESKEGEMRFGHDYVRWASEIGQLSHRYANLKGFSVDDFGYNLKLFTPEYVGRMHAALHAENPGLKFYPLLYWKSITPKFLDAYASAIDGVIFAYRNEPTIDTSRIGPIHEQLTQAEHLLSERKKALVLMIYCWRLGRIPISPDAAYVRAITQAGIDDTKKGALEGVVTYCVPLDDQPEPAAENFAHQGRGRATILATGLKVPAGTLGEVSRKFPLEPGSGPRRLAFWHTATYAGVPAGACVEQVAVDGAVVWEQDATAAPTKEWREDTADLTAALAGKSEAVLSFRLALKQVVPSIALTAGFDDLQPDGFAIADPGFESNLGWLLHGTSPAMAASIQVFDPQRPRKLFWTVQELFHNTRW